jgi:diguanylate cyclase (GGDEF)-like protein
LSAATAHRRLFVFAAIATYAAVFVSFSLVEVPGLGLAHFFYLAIALVAVTAGPRWGSVAGLVATTLYALGILLNSKIPSTEVTTLSTAIRLATYTGTGALIGWFSEHNRLLVERLQLLAERDSLTGLPNTRAFEAAITRRLEAAQPFALLVADVDGLRSVNEGGGAIAGNDALLELAGGLAKLLGPEDEIARVGGDEFAILTSLASCEEAAELAIRLEQALNAEGTPTTFGWAVSPQEGTNALAVYRAADERLYGRKVVRKCASVNVAQVPRTTLSV